MQYVFLLLFVSGRFYYFYYFFIDLWRTSVMSFSLRGKTGAPKGIRAPVPIYRNIANDVGVLAIVKLFARRRTPATKGRIEIIVKARYVIVMGVYKGCVVKQVKICAKIGRPQRASIDH